MASGGCDGAGGGTAVAPPGRRRAAPAGCHRGRGCSANASARGRRASVSARRRGVGISRSAGRRVVCRRTRASRRGAGDCSGASDPAARRSGYGVASERPQCAGIPACFQTQARPTMRKLHLAGTLSWHVGGGRGATWLDWHRRARRRASGPATGDAVTRASDATPAAAGSGATRAGDPRRFGRERQRRRPAAPRGARRPLFCDDGRARLR